MKKYLFFIQAAVMLAVSSVGLVSCGKDDVVHGGKTIVVYSVVGGWYKWLTSSTIIGCRFDANGDAYFDSWSNSPSWEDPLSLRKRRLFLGVTSLSPRKVRV